MSRLLTNTLVSSFTTYYRQRAHAHARAHAHTHTPFVMLYKAEVLKLYLEPTDA
jgi:hypothetical protein